MRRITVFDTTLRDGEQSPGFTMNVEEKVTMAEQLARLGVDIIEAGFPIASKQDFEAVRAVAQAVGDKAIVAGLCRTKFMDIDRTGEDEQQPERNGLDGFGQDDEGENPSNVRRESCHRGRTRRGEPCIQSGGFPTLRRANPKSQD